MRAAAAAVLALTLTTTAAWAQGEAGASAAPPDEVPAPSGSVAPESPPTSSSTDLEQAKELFHQGNALRRAGDFPRALELYLKSRALVPSVPNTMNAALCLAEVDRSDEALEMYEALLIDFRDELGEAERATIADAVSGLRRKVGQVDVQANVKGTLVIDGRPRGRLPLLSAVRVLPGRHAVAVIEEGYRAFETQVEVKVGATALVSATLEPLTAGGRLRVEAPSLAGAQIFVDGAPVGTAPWAGTLEAGPHYFLARKGDSGSAPRSIVIVAGQQVDVATELAPLGPEQRISTRPASAELLVGGVSVGAGGWQGRLPLGTHTLLAREEGYRDATRDLVVTPDSAGAIELALEVDEDHPRWATGEVGAFWIDVLGGFGLAPSLGSGAEDSCAEQRCDSDPMALGFIAAARGGYELSFGLSFEIAGGYLMLRKSLERIRAGSFEPGGVTQATQHDLDQLLAYSGPFAAAGIGYRLPLGELLELGAHVLVGAHFSTAYTEASGGVATSGDPVPVTVQGSGSTANATNLMLLPELRFGFRRGGFGAGLSATLAVLTLDGPPHGLGDVQPAGDLSVCSTTPAAASCVPGNGYLSEERSYGTFLMVAPSLYAGYVF